MKENSNYQKTLEWYENNAQNYSQKSNLNSSIDYQQLLEFSKLIPTNGIILDAGCGSGRDTNLFQQQGFNIIGIDISKNLLVHAKKNYPKLDIQFGDILNLPFENNHFDGVWAHASVVHFDQDSQITKAISEFSRVLKPKGLLHLLVRAQKNNFKTSVSVDSISNHERFYRNFSKDEIKKILSETGFIIENQLQYNESDLDPNKRPGEGIEWILTTAKKA